ncbi:hypothetical protein ACLIA0_13015 [Bacillaceae bacterium W0354]
MDILIPFIGLGSLFMFVTLLIVVIIGLIIRKKWGKKLIVWSLAPLIILIACIQIDISNDSVTAADVKNNDFEKEEELYVKVIDANYDQEEDRISLSADTNLPEGTKVYLHLWHSEELADYISSPIVEDGKLNATFGDEEGQLVVSGTYTINTTMYVNDSEYNPSFYRLYGDHDEVSSRVDGEVDNYFGHYVIDFGSIGEVEAVDAYTNEESDQAYRDYVRKQEELKEKELEEKKQSAKEIRFKELDKNPDKYYGEFIKYRGEILQIMEETTSTVIRLAVTKDSYGYDLGEVVYITYEGTTPFVEEDVITVYGTIKGSHTYESQAGYHITLPHMEAEIIE